MFKIKSEINIFVCKINFSLRKQVLEKEENVKFLGELYLISYRIK